ncbi:MAG: GGDEF domain-containing protein, partial [Desulfovibrio fairfieldensis]|nr:GGDEF domain-containing protein [Desulfovibrio fairfieldensis]
GDRVLVLAARLARENAGEDGMVARWGGDEFFGLLHADAEESRALLERLLAAMREHPELRKWGVSLSIGVTRIKETDDMDSLVSRADEALYRSKKDGRDRLSFI